MERDSVEKLARFEAAIPFLSKEGIAARWDTLSENEKVAFQAIIRAAAPVLNSIKGAIAPMASKAMGAGRSMMGSAGGTAGKAMNALGAGMTVAGAGQAAWGAMNPQPNVPQPQLPQKTGSLVKQALAMGLHDALDLGAYGLLAAGPLAEIAAPQFAENHHRALAAADVAGLGILARHHIPGLMPAAH